MTTYETNIGILTGYENSNMVTVGDLKTEIINGCYYSPKKYCDWRYGTNLQRFKYDPYTGDEIDWREVKNLLTKI